VSPYFYLGQTPTTDETVPYAAHYSIAFNVFEASLRGLRSLNIDVPVAEVALKEQVRQPRTSTGEFLV